MLRPHVLLFLADDVGVGDVSASGFSTTLVSTPNLDRLATDGAAFGFMFGMMDVEDAPQRLRQEERLSAPIGVTIGATVGAINAILAYRAEASVGESIDLLRAEGLLDD